MHYALAGGRDGPEPFWRARGDVVLAQLPPRCFEGGTGTSARLLYALCRELAGTLRTTTGLLMHLGMQWRHARLAAGAAAALPG